MKTTEIAIFGILILFGPAIASADRAVGSYSSTGEDTSGRQSDPCYDLRTLTDNGSRTAQGDSMAQHVADAYKSCLGEKASCQNTAKILKDKEMASSCGGQQIKTAGCVGSGDAAGGSCGNCCAGNGCYPGTKACR